MRVGAVVSKKGMDCFLKEAVHTISLHEMMEAGMLYIGQTADESVESCGAEDILCFTCAYT